MGIPEAGAAGQIFNGLNGAVQSIPLHQQMQLQNLGFFDGFKKGFGMVMKPAAQIAGGIGGAMGIPEAGAAGQIFNGLNGAVQSIPLHLQNLATQAQLCADYRSRCSAVGGGKFGSVSACVSDVSGGMC